MVRSIFTIAIFFTMNVASFSQTSIDSFTVFSRVLEKSLGYTEIDMGNSNILAGLDTSYLLDESHKPKKFRNTIDALNLLSMNGWELVDFKTGGTDNMVHTIYLFKMRVARK